MEYAEKAVELSPNNAQLIANQAMILSYTGKPEASIALINKAIRLSPYYLPWYPAVSGLAYMHTGEYDKAVAAQHDAIATALEAVCDSIARGEAQATAQQVALLQFRLRALRPEIYRERVAVAAVAQDGDGGGGEGGRARLLLAEWTS